MRRFATLLSLTAFIGAIGCGGGDAEADDPMMEDMEMETPPADAASKAPPAGAMVMITSPANGAEIQGTEVTVTLEAMGIPLAPGGEYLEGTGHHHLFLDTDVVPAGNVIPSGLDNIVHLGLMQTEHTFTDLTPGEHTIIAVMADGLHFPFDPSVQASVTFTVVEGG